MKSGKCLYCRVLVAWNPATNTFAAHQFRGSQCAGSQTTVPDEVRT